MERVLNNHQMPKQEEFCKKDSLQQRLQKGILSVKTSRLVLIKLELQITVKMICARFCGISSSTSISEDHS